jgi:hypothetical protein
MFLIKKIDLDDCKCYKSSCIYNYTTDANEAKALLDKTAIDFVRIEKGREACEKTKIIEINSLDQVNEPLIDCILLYRLIDNPDRIYVYQKNTIVTKQKTWTWDTVDVLVSKFRQTNFFELEEFNIVLPTKINPVKEIVEKNEETRIVTYSKFDLIEELRNSPRFKKAKEELD